MLTIKISIRSNVFEFSGSAPFAEIRELLDLWLALVGHPDSGDAQAALDALVTRLSASTSTLARAVAAHTLSTQ